LAQGLLTGKYEKGRRPAGSRAAEKTTAFWMDRHFAPATVAAVDRARQAAERAGTTLPAVAFRWCLRDPNVASVISGVTSGDRIAIIWEGDDPAQTRRITYRELLRDVERFAAVLRRNGVKRADRVCIYMPMVPETAVAMLACTRIGAVHSVVFGGFSSESLR